jgi:hypothetical protein
VAARAAEALPGISIRRAAGLDLPIGNSKPLENAILPSHAEIVQLALEMVK